MAKFEGTIQEFHHFVGPKIRNAINVLTKAHRDKRKNICENCKENTRLESAHKNGKGRRLIIETVLSHYRTGDKIRCDIGAVEKKILKAHEPIEDFFKFLCKDCHVKYDSKSTLEINNGSRKREKAGNQNRNNNNLVAKQKSSSKRISKSEKYKSIRHLVETLFQKNKEIQYKEMEKILRREYPSSAFDKGHFSWYKNKIIKEKIWKYA